MPQDRSFFDRVLDILAGPLAPAPPQPLPPLTPPEIYDEMKVNELRVRQVANIVANENLGLWPLVGKTTREDLQRARVAQAHAVINADKMYGSDRSIYAPTASDEVSASVASSPQYQRALDAARTAFQEQLSGHDPLGGRTYYNNRYSDYMGLRQLGNRRVAVFERYGPFKYGNGIAYTIINENPKNMPAPPRR
jgi:hypothetical protein